MEYTMLSMDAYMNSHGLQMARKLFKNKLTSSNKNIPLDVTYQVTFRCNLECKYCGLPGNSENMDELSTEEAKKAISDFADMGTQRISFTGGEPLIREDIGKLIDFAKYEGIPKVDVFTNGTLVEDKISEIENANRVYISLDGPKEINKNTRGEDIYDTVLASLKSLTNKDMETGLITTISKNNTPEDLSSIKHLLKIARKYNSRFLIHPLFSHEWNEDFIDRERPDSDKNNKVIRFIMELFQEFDCIGRNPSIYNYWLQWMDNKETSLKSFAGSLYTWVYPNGEISPCHFATDQKINGRELGFKKAFKKMDGEAHEHDRNCFFYGMDRDFWFNIFNGNMKEVIRGLKEGKNEII